MEAKKIDIYQIEEEVKQMHMNGEGEPQRQKLLEHFWYHHIIPVKAYSLDMVGRYGGEGEIVHLGAILHDMALIEGDEYHDETGAKKAYEYLLSRGASEEVAAKVRDIVLRHMCKRYMPETLEEKIVATADALAHFFPEFHETGAVVLAEEDHVEMKVLDIAKLEKVYMDKVFFDDEKKVMEKVMSDFRKLYYNK